MSTTIELTACGPFVLQSGEPVPAYGEVSGENQSVNLTLTLQSVWYKYVEFEANGATDSTTTSDHTLDQITVTKPGVWLCAISVDWDGTTGQDYEWEPFKNGVRLAPANIHIESRLPSAGYSTGCAVGLINLVAGDVIDLRVRCITQAGAVVRGRNTNLTLVKVA